MDNRMEIQKTVKLIKEQMVGNKYRHFKGNMYEVIAVAVHSETEEAMVIYRSCTDLSLVWCRPLTMFLSEVDHEKYPDVKQRFRFQKVSEEEFVAYMSDTIKEHNAE